MNKENITPVRKMLNFDLDQARLKEFYPGSSPNNAYTKIGAFLKKNGFEHVQGSGYISKEPILEVDVNSLINELIEKNIWLVKCFKAFSSTDVTNRTDRMPDIIAVGEDVKRIQTKSKNINKTRLKG